LPELAGLGDDGLLVPDASMNDTNGSFVEQRGSVA
jgi:hypothetical protein